MAASPPETDGHGVRSPNRVASKLRSKASGFYFADAVNKSTRAELEEAHHHGDGEHPELEAAAEDFQGVTETGVPRKAE